MTSQQLSELCKRRAIRIWTDHAAAQTGAPWSARMPSLRNDYCIGAELLFVGMNPSYSDGAMKRLLHQEFGREQDPDDFFSWVASREAAELERRATAIARFEGRARKDYAYYKRLRAFAKAACANTHDHIDMFLIRHTKQQQVEAAYFHSAARLNDTPFAFEQFALFLDTLEAMRPKVVVVASAAAGHLAIDAMKLQSHDGRRTYRWSKLPRVPIFLCGMLCGQRALDTHSRTRLETDVKAALQAYRLTDAPKECTGPIDSHPGLTLSS